MDIVIPALPETFRSVDHLAFGAAAGKGTNGKNDSPPHDPAKLTGDFTKIVERYEALR